MVVSDGTRLSLRVVHTSSGGGEVDGSPLIIRVLYRFDPNRLRFALPLLQSTK